MFSITAEDEIREIVFKVKITFFFINDWTRQLSSINRFTGPSLL
jgi:hypothetical protein